MWHESERARRSSTFSCVTSNGVETGAPWYTSINAQSYSEEVMREALLGLTEICGSLFVNSRELGRRIKWRLLAVRNLMLMPVRMLECQRYWLYILLVHWFDWGNSTGRTIGLYLVSSETWRRAISSFARCVRVLTSLRIILRGHVSLSAIRFLVEIFGTHQSKASGHLLSCPV
jgi:hypothetical protein